jgi:hypothetical protein
LSKVAIKGASTGTATFTIESPATNTNRTLTLPDAAGTVSVADSNGIISANGIAFPATQSASANVNTLDDYEEGTFNVTWTPATSGSITIDDNLGYYTKIGNVVYFSIITDTSSISSPSGVVSLDGLPFSVPSEKQSSVSIGFKRRWATDMPNLVGHPSGTSIVFYKTATNATTATQLNSTDFSGSSNFNTLWMSGFYFI